MIRPARKDRDRPCNLTFADFRSYEDSAGCISLCLIRRPRSYGVYKTQPLAHIISTPSDARTSCTYHTPFLLYSNSAITYIYVCLTLLSRILIYSVLVLLTFVLQIAPVTLPVSTPRVPRMALGRRSSSGSPGSAISRWNTTVMRRVRAVSAFYASLWHTVDVPTGTGPPSGHRSIVSYGGRAQPVSSPSSRQPIQRGAGFYHMA